MVSIETLFLHHAISTKTPAMNNPTLNITDHINTSELFKNALVNDSLNKIKEAIINKIPTSIGFLLL